MSAPSPARAPRPRPAAMHRALRARLRALATERQREGAERYFRHVVRFHGVPTPAIREVAREAWKTLAARPAGEVEALALELLQAEWFEEKHLGVLFLQRIQRQLDAAFLARLAPVVDRAVYDWGTCDALAGRVLRPLVAREAAARRRVVAWSRAAHPWRQRAAAVGFLAEAHHGRCEREILAICDRLSRRDHRFVQLGMGWVLRELWLQRPDSVVAFLRARYPLLRREALRYAIEKMPGSLQRRLLAEHAAARARMKR